MQEEHPGTDELGRLLGAFASARLAPDRTAVTRLRAGVIEEARMRVLDARLSRGRRRRARFAALAIAAALTIGGTASVTAASSAGGPLYQVRIWLETAGLSGDENTRALERLHQVDARVLDLERAASAGDENAVSAAIDAYRDAVRAAVEEAEVGTDNDRLEALKAALDLHLVVLERLSQRVPDPAMKAINHAIEASHKAVERIDRPKRGEGGGSTGAEASPSPTPAPAASRAPHASDGPASPSESGSDGQGDPGH